MRSQASCPHSTPLLLLVKPIRLHVECSLSVRSDPVPSVLFVIPFWFNGWDDKYGRALHFMLTVHCSLNLIHGCVTRILNAKRYPKRAFKAKCLCHRATDTERERCATLSGEEDCLMLHLYTANGHT